MIALAAIVIVRDTGGMTLDFSPLAKALSRLKEGLARYECDITDEQIRDGLIQRFEFTYDLAPKMLRRVLEESADNPSEIDLMSFPTLIRTGWEKGFLKAGWPAWHEFRKMRNTTSHQYSEAKAIEVVAQLPAFIEETQYLVYQLQNRAVA